MIQIFSQSSIQLNSLETAFKLCEQEKTRKIRLISDLTAIRYFFQNEAQIVTDFFKNVEAGEEISSFGSHMNAIYIATEIEGEQLLVPKPKFPGSRLPFSVEGL